MVYIEKTCLIYLISILPLMRRMLYFNIAFTSKCRILHQYYYYVSAYPLICAGLVFSDFFYFFCHHSSTKLIRIPHKTLKSHRLWIPYQLMIPIIRNSHNPFSHKNKSPHVCFLTTLNRYFFDRLPITLRGLLCDSNQTPTPSLTRKKAFK